ncbi:MAG: ATP-binding cassette domain-containing protein [Vibrio sp.]
MTSIVVKDLTLDYPMKGFSKSKNKTKSSVGGNILLKNNKPVLRALDNISFSINKGDRVALIGHNGSGKSTLLKVMAGIYKPHHGSVEVDGKVAPLFNLKFGMDNELSGYENIVLRGLYLGFTLKEIKKKRPLIAEQSELGDFLHMPIKTYSSGMLARLAFAVSTSVDADILLLDEMIGTGDANFINKAKEMIDRFISNSNILVLASHSNKVLRQICNKAILFEHGRLVTAGDIEEVLTVYRHKIELEKGTPNKIESSKKALLVNDTGFTENLGCRAVKEGVVSLLKESVEVTDSIPLGYLQEAFNDIASKSKDYIDKSQYIPRKKDFTSSVSFSEWKKIADKVLDNDQYLKNVSKLDVVIVNAEGSIHHDSKRALALLALIKAFKDAGKVVIVLNATIEAMNSDILTYALNDVDVIHVRENKTHEYLSKIGIKSIVYDDIANIYIGNSPEYKISSIDDQKKSRCLLSQGVLNNPESLKKSIDVIRNNGYEPYYLTMSDGNEDSVANEVCKALNVKLFYAKDIMLEDFCSFIKQFDIVVSGRHHLNLFVLHSGVNLICFPSNTYKIEGTMELYGISDNIVYSYSELENLLKERSDSMHLSPSKVFNNLNKNTSELKSIINETIRSI